MQGQKAGSKRAEVETQHSTTLPPYLAGSKGKGFFKPSKEISF